MSLREELSIDRCYHHEYGGYVYQIRGYRSWVEPFVTEKEAQAFLKGVEYADQQNKGEQE